MTRDQLIGLAIATLTLLLGWGGKELIALKVTVGILSTKIDIYIQNASGNAAKILERAINPTPDEMKILLHKWREGLLEGDDLIALEVWLEELLDNESQAKGERVAAATILAAIASNRPVPTKARGFR